MATTDQRRITLLEQRLRALSQSTGDVGPGAPGAPGTNGTNGTDGVDGAPGSGVPTRIADNGTFIVAADTQAATHQPIVLGYGARIDIQAGGVLVTVGVQ